MRTSFFFFITLLLISLSGFSQHASSWSHYLSVGIKRNIFSMGSQEITAVNPSPRYSDNLIKPKTNSTLSFAFALKSYKIMNRRWTFFNTIGLDMQQLSVVSGMKKYFDNGTITSYKTFDIHQLYPRLKLNAGFDYTLIKKQNAALSLGISAGQMLRLSKEGYSYSFFESKLSVKQKNYKIFLSGSFSPYNVSIPGNEEFFGDINAQAVNGSITYRIVDITAGVAVRL